MADSGNVGRIEVEYGANLGPLARELEAGKAKVSQFTKEVKDGGTATGGSLTSGANLAAGALGGMLRIAAAIGGLGFAKSALDDAAALNKLALSAGLTSIEFQRLQSGAKLNGFSGEFGPALAQFANNATLARSKMGELFETLKFAAPALADQLSRTKTTSQALEVYAEAIRRVEGDEAKAVLTKKAFGDEGLALLPILSRGAEGIAKMRSEADEFGTVITAQATKAAKDLNTELGYLYDTAKAKLANGLGPIAESVANSLKAVRSAASDMNKLSPVYDSMGNVAGFTENVVASTDAIKKQGEAAKETAEAVGKWSTTLKTSDSFKLQQKPDYRGADAVIQSLQALAAARAKS